jgi:hypothetical protein
MIYQCYFKKEQESNLFITDIYYPFGLEPQVNPSITLNCPELEDPATRLSLTEYGAFLNIYRNDVFKKDSDQWIGFTSYRQLDKTPIIFKNKNKFEELLFTICNGFAGWGYYHTFSNASHQAEVCHPGINNFINYVFKQLNIKIPERFYKDTFLLFANYWVMTKHMFIDFMEFSWPIIQFASQQKNHPYVSEKSPIETVDTRKWLGYFMERLFLIWYMSRNYYPANIGPVCGKLI